MLITQQLNEKSILYMLGIFIYFRRCLVTYTVANECLDTLLEKAKLAREISDEKNEIPHKFLGRKI